MLASYQCLSCSSALLHLQLPHTIALPTTLIQMLLSVRSFNIPHRQICPCRCFRYANILHHHSKLLTILSHFPKFQEWHIQSRQALQTYRLAPIENTPMSPPCLYTTVMPHAAPIVIIRNRAIHYHCSKLTFIKRLSSPFRVHLAVQTWIRKNLVRAHFTTVLQIATGTSLPAGVTLVLVHPTSFLSQTATALPFSALIVERTAHNNTKKKQKRQLKKFATFTTNLSTTSMSMPKRTRAMSLCHLCAKETNHAPFIFISEHIC